MHAKEIHCYMIINRLSKDGNSEEIDDFLLTTVLWICMRNVGV